MSEINDTIFDRVRRIDEDLDCANTTLFELIMNSRMLEKLNEEQMDCLINIINKIIGLTNNIYDQVRLVEQLNLDTEEPND